MCSLFCEWEILRKCFLKWIIKEYYLRIVTHHHWAWTAILKVKSSFWKGVITSADGKLVERILSLFAQSVLQRSFEIQFGWIDPDPRSFIILPDIQSCKESLACQQSCHFRQMLWLFHVFMPPSAPGWWEPGWKRRQECAIGEETLVKKHCRG